MEAGRLVISLIQLSRYETIQFGQGDGIGGDDTCWICNILKVKPTGLANGLDQG